MPVLTGDILMRLSVGAGSAGGAMAGSSVTSGVMNNVWPDISDAERLSGGDLFRKTFWVNNNNIDSLIEPVVYVPVLPLEMEISIGLGFDAAQDDNALQGSMTAFTTNSAVEIVADGSDARTVTIYGLDASSIPVTEDINLSNDPVLGLTTFSKVWAAVVEATHATNTIEIRQGAGGVLRGTIIPEEQCTWLWIVNPETKGAGLALPDLGAGQSYGIWHRLHWLPGASPVRPNSLTARIEEA